MSSENPKIIQKTFNNTNCVITKRSCKDSVTDGDKSITNHKKGDNEVSGSDDKHSTVISHDVAEKVVSTETHRCTTEYLTDFIVDDSKLADKEIEFLDKVNTDKLNDAAAYCGMKRRRENKDIKDSVNDMFMEKEKERESNKGSEGIDNDDSQVEIKIITTNIPVHVIDLSKPRKKRIFKVKRKTKK